MFPFVTLCSPFPKGSTLAEYKEGPFFLEYEVRPCTTHRATRSTRSNLKDKNPCPRRRSDVEKLGHLLPLLARRSRNQSFKVRPRTSLQHPIYRVCERTDGCKETLEHVTALPSEIRSKAVFQKKFALISFQIFLPMSCILLVKTRFVIYKIEGQTVLGCLNQAFIVRPQFLAHAVGVEIGSTPVVRLKS